MTIGWFWLEPNQSDEWIGVVHHRGLEVGTVEAVSAIEGMSFRIFLYLTNHGIWGCSSRNALKFVRFFWTVEEIHSPQTRSSWVSGLLTTASNARSFDLSDALRLLNNRLSWKYARLDLTRAFCSRATVCGGRLLYFGSPSIFQFLHGMRRKTFHRDINSFICTLYS